MVRLDDGEIYRAHAGALVALATTLVGPAAAADVVAAAVARTLASPGWGEVEDRYAYWVRAVVNEARSSHRSAMRREAREALVAVRDRSDGAVGPPDPVDPRILDVVAALSVRQRSVMFLAYWQDLPIAEIARTLGISEGSVRRHLARARATLRRRLT